MSETREGYTEIKTVFTSDATDTIEEVRLEDVDVEEIPPLEEENVAQEAEPTEEVQEEELKEELKEAPKLKKNTGRATKRIKDLVSKNKEKDDLIARMTAEAVALQQQLQDGNKTSKESMKDILEGKMLTLNKELAEAIRDGEADEVPAIQNQMMDVKMQLAGISSELVAIEQVKEKPKKEEVPQVPTMPEKAQEWIEEHKMFKTDPLFYSAALITNNQLVNEGFSPEDDDFYEELDNRLKVKFPEAFGVFDENSVESKVEDKKSSSSDSEDVKQKEPQKARTVQQTVAGSSRSTANKIQPRKSKTVELSAADIAQAGRWDLDIGQITKRASHIENTRDANGYSPIFIPNKK